MEIVFCDINNTELEIKTVKLRGTLIEHIEELRERGNIETLYIGDCIPCNKYFCDQGCEPGTGCKEFYKEDDHAIFLRYQIIYKDILPDGA